MTFQPAVCAEMVLADLPLLERIHAAGFAVEIWGWTDKDAEALKATTTPAPHSPGRRTLSLWSRPSTARTSR